MSHFLLLVRLHSAIGPEGLEAALATSMLPYGRWQKWDWYEIGGRWDRNLHTLSGPNNFARICQVDWDKHERIRDQLFDEFKTSFRQFAAGVAQDVRDPFAGPRWTAIDLGLIECKNKDELTDTDRAEGRILMEWPSRPGRFDVVRLPSDSEMEAFRCTFMPGFAFLDAAGWHANGEMGWFGVSHGGTGDGEVQFKQAVYDSLRKGGDETDWIVFVDCHI